MEFVVIAIAAYLAGSIPSAYLAGRARGLDIRKAGSGNPGATNALRVLGPTAAAIVLVADAGKGALSVLAIAPMALYVLSPSAATASSMEMARVVAGAACVLGHVFPAWLRFKGGKGVATGAAVAATLAPAAAATCLVFFIATVAMSKFVSFGSIIAAITLPAAYAGLYRADAFSPRLFWFFVAAAVLVVYMHRKNIARLAGGTEPRLGEKKRRVP